MQQLRPYSAAQSINAFRSGYGLGQQIKRDRDQTNIASAFTNGGPTEASRVANQAGRFDLAEQFRQFEARASEQERAAALQQIERGAQIAYSLAQIPLEQRMEQAQRLGLQVTPDDLTDESLMIDYRQAIPILEQAKLRKNTVTEFGDNIAVTDTDQLTGQATTAQTARRGPTFAEDTARMNAETARQRADQDAAQFQTEQTTQAQEAADPTTVATLQTMLGNIDRLAPGGDLNNGLRASFGFRKGLTGPITLAGTDKAAAQALVEQVVGGLTLEQAESLKGVLSDKDMLLLERSASVLGNRGISDAEAERALQEIRELFTIRLQQAGAASPEQAQPQSTGYELPNGQVLPEGQTIQQNGRTFIVRNGQVVPQ